MANKLDLTGIENSFDVHDLMRGVAYVEDHSFYGNKGGAGVATDLANTLASTMYKITDGNGQRLPMVQVTNNPSLLRPTVSGMKYFGQSPIPKYAMDQVLLKAIGVFHSVSNGAGGNAFHFTNSGAFAGPQSITSIMNTLIGGTGSSDLLTSVINDSISNITGMLGAKPNDQIDLTDPNQMLQLLVGVSTSFAGQTSLSKSPFSKDDLYAGVLLANQVSTLLQQKNQKLDQLLKGY